MAVSITNLLNRVWDEFRRVGIADDLRIMEGVAALLLELEVERLHALVSNGGDE